MPQWRLTMLHSDVSSLTQRVAAWRSRLLVGGRRRLAVSDRTPMTRFWDMSTQQEVASFSGKVSAFSPNGTILAAGYPVVNGECVDHHSGPFDAIRLQFNVLRNLRENAERILKCVTALATLSMNPAPNIDAIQSEIDAITEHWESSGISPGSSEALQVNW